MKCLAYTILMLLVAGLVWYVIARHHSTAADNLEEFRQRPGGLFTAEAGEYLIELAKAGKLPGFALGGHGTMHAGILDANVDTPSGIPTSHTRSHVGSISRRTGTPPTPFTSVVGESQGSPLRLQKTWRTDAEGHLAENYTVP
jgi:hypothetical protein